MIKRKPHHDLKAIQQKFSSRDTLEITAKAYACALELGYDRQDIVDAVQDLERADFVKSTAAHSPPIKGVWHDTYRMTWDKRDLYIKFAGAIVVDVTLVSFKESD